VFPLADTHVHLLGGLDDGPRTREDAVEMAAAIVVDGGRHATALAHQNPHFPLNDAPRLRSAAANLTTDLAAAGVELHVYPTGEVMLTPDTLDDFRAGKLLTVGDRGRHLLVEMPAGGTFVDLVPLAAQFKAIGVRLVVAHAERYPEFLHDPATTDRHIAAGCLIQVTAGELANPASAADEAALKDWAKRGVIHVLGSDGHNLRRRPPLMSRGVEVLSRWAGPAAAERVAGTWGVNLLQGLPVTPPPPRPKPRRWFGRLLGG
jgi:protein-tyrosine phosphatase